MKRFYALQTIAWVLLFVLYYFYLKSRWPNIAESLAISHAVIAFLFFALMIYGYSLFLFPRFFKSALTTKFVLISLCFFITVYCLRIVTESELIPTITSGNKGIFYYGKVQMLYNLVSSLIAFSIAVLFTHVIGTLRAEKLEHEILHRQLESELKFLKSQVQPHFLFNSLNNIYYDTYKELPRVADRISMLAEMMRYFLEESHKETVSVKTEIQILKNYIELEKERFNGVNVLTNINVNDEVHIPPMLLIPLIENLFKHANFKNGKANTAFINLKTDSKNLELTTTNSYKSKITTRQGTGLINLEKRLTLYFGEDYTLSTNSDRDLYHATLKFPLHNK